MIKIISTLVSVVASGVFLWGTYHQIVNQQTMNSTFGNILGQVQHASNLTSETLNVVSPISDIVQGVETMNNKLSTGVIPNLTDANNSLNSITETESAIIAALGSLNSVTTNTVGEIGKVADANRKVLGLIGQANDSAGKELGLMQNLSSLTDQSIKELTVLNKKFAMLSLLP
ncbi:hypothetical protein [Effusibacillus consociatus]|uniref:Uncharacterized protein n=1 Tax=Effusibacillus consociatus TaxID=1117041 RepID=A0ABV9PX90_9BACL